MIYVEYLRARRVLLWFTIGVLLAVAIPFFQMLAHYGELHAEIERSLLRNADKPMNKLPVAAIVAVCAVLSFIYASIIGAGLARERATVAIAWTKPVDRAVQALRVAGIDILGILASIGVCVAVCVLFSLPLATWRFVAFNADFTGSVAIVIGCSIMFYAEVQLASILAPAKASITGLSWPIFFVLSFLGKTSLLPDYAHGFFVGLNVINPFAWLTAASIQSGRRGVAVSADAGHTDYFGHLPLAVEVLAPWLIAAACIALTAYLWKTKEA